jgi:hypothetical protein
VSEQQTDTLTRIWDEGYTVAELWGFTSRVTRGTSVIDRPHGLLWGILGIVEYQVNKGAGHRYLRERLKTGDWIAIGRLVPKEANPDLSRVPVFEEAKFGRKQSAVGDDTVEYVDVRVVHGQLYAQMTQSG